MTLDEQMQDIVDELISKNGVEYMISSQELKLRLQATYGTNYSSIIPSDYCYNRVNKGIDFPEKKPRLLKRVDRGLYECLGRNYPYDGPVYARPKGTKADVVVGYYRKGEFKQNGNWERYF